MILDDDMAEIKRRGEEQLTRDRLRRVESQACQSASKPTTIAERIEAQRLLCEQKGLPHFAPGRGVCWSCHRQIYEVVDGTTFITGCPHCHRSYCD